MRTEYPMLDMKVVLIPTWLEDALNAASKPLVTCLDAVALSSIVSNDDVAFYIDLNNRLLPELFPELAESLYGGTLYPFFKDGVDQTVLRNLQDYLSKRMSDLHLEHPTLPLYTAISFFAPQTSGNDAYHGSAKKDYTFEAFSLSSDVIAIRVRLKNPDESSQMQDLAAYDTFFTLLSTYVPMEQFAQTTVFRKYVELSRQTA
jgi:hypothetical protein